jgi:hypothetical protein
MSINDVYNLVLNSLTHRKDQWMLSFTWKSMKIIKNSVQSFMKKYLS